MGGDNNKQLIHARRRARRSAAQAVYQWQMTAQRPGAIREQFVKEQDMRGTDNEYFTELVTQIPQCVAELDAQLTPFLDRTIEEVDPVERAILRIGAYELAHRIDVPYRVVIDEAVNSAKKFGASDGFKYINHVLDQLSLQLRKLERP